MAASKTVPFVRAALVVIAAAGAALFLLVPPRPRTVVTAGWTELAGRTAAGAYHVHTTRSDGHGDRSAVARAAARAGLKFVILTDHGDGTRPPDPPSYVDGVLILDAVEISTEDGHYVALDLPRAPYPLGGSADAVVEDVRRLGGFGLAAHPDSPKPSLRWTSTAVPDGVEWLNFDSEWRDETRANLVRAAAAYSVRPAPALASILSRPVTLDARWPALLATGPALALAAADAHGGVGRRAEDASRTLAGSVGIPSYEASFRTFSNRVVLETPLTGDPTGDARAIYAALRRRRVFSTIDALAAPALLDFAVEMGFSRESMGVLLGEDADATLVARATVPEGAEMSIVRNGRIVTTTRGGEVRHVVTGAKGGYRVEIQIPGAPGTPPVPWLVSNAIYFGPPRPVPPPVEPLPVGKPIAPFPWRIEKDTTSSATLRTIGSAAMLEYKLGGGARAGQFVAVATDITKQDFQRVDLQLRADRPQRVSVQLRGANGRRWGRSYYVDPGGSVLRVPIAALRPIASPDPAPAVSRDVTSLLLVVDLTNAAPGRTGTLSVLSSAFSR